VLCENSFGKAMGWYVSAVVSERITGPLSHWQKMNLEHTGMDNFIEITFYR